MVALLQGTTRFTGKVEEQQEPKAKKTDGTLTSYVHQTIHFMTSLISYMHYHYYTLYIPTCTLALSPLPLPSP